MDKDSPALHEQYRDPFKLLDRATTGYKFVVIPAICIVTGGFVGLIGKVRAAWIAVVALVPLQTFLLAADSFAVWAFARALLYFLLAYFCATRVQNMRGGSPRRTAPTTA
jgi:hypothetical protein